MTFLYSPHVAGASINSEKRKVDIVEETTILMVQVWDIKFGVRDVESKNLRRREGKKLVVDPPIRDMIHRDKGSKGDFFSAKAHERE